MRIEGGDKQGNIRHALELVGEAANQGCDIALLPEVMNLGWTHPSCRLKADPIPEGETFQRLSKAAESQGIYLCAGLAEKAGDKVFNTAILIDRHGKLLLVHRKINELDIAQPYYALGDRLNVCQTEFGTIGVMICADGFAQDRVLSRSLGYMGADIILSPSAWAVPSDHDNVKDPYGKTWFDAYIPVAQEFSIWILGVSNVGWITDGPWAGRQCIGNSLVIGPKGQTILQGPYGVDAEAILNVEVTPINRPARGTGWKDLWVAEGANRTK
jgi:predicted amidohydrolase